MPDAPSVAPLGRGGSPGTVPLAAPLTVPAATMIDRPLDRPFGGGETIASPTIPLAEPAREPHPGTVPLALPIAPIAPISPIVPKTANAPNALSPGRTPLAIAVVSGASLGIKGGPAAKTALSPVAGSIAISPSVAPSALGKVDGYAPFSSTASAANVLGGNGQANAPARPQSMSAIPPPPPQVMAFGSAPPPALPSSPPAANATAFGPVIPTPLPTGPHLPSAPPPARESANPSAFGPSIEVPPGARAGSMHPPNGAPTAFGPAVQQPPKPRSPTIPPPLPPEARQQGTLLGMAAAPQAAPPPSPSAPPSQPKPFGNERNESYERVMRRFSQPAIDVADVVDDPTGQPLTYQVYSPGEITGGRPVLKSSESIAIPGTKASIGLRICLVLLGLCVVFGTAAAVIAVSSDDAPKVVPAASAPTVTAPALPTTPPAPTAPATTAVVAADPPPADPPPTAPTTTGTGKPRTKPTSTTPSTPASLKHIAPPPNPYGNPTSRK